MVCLVTCCYGAGSLERLGSMCVRVHSLTNQLTKTLAADDFY